MEVSIVVDSPIEKDGKQISFVPERGSALAAGYDVKAREIKIEDGLAKVKLGIRLHCSGHAVYIIPRSSLSTTGWIMANSIGLVDEDYRGELQIRFRPLVKASSPQLEKLSLPKFPYEVGDRVGQIVLVKTIPMDFQVVETLEETQRGEGGFGHTGR